MDVDTIVVFGCETSRKMTTKLLVGHSYPSMDIFAMRKLGWKMFGCNYYSYIIYIDLAGLKHTTSMHGNQIMEGTRETSSRNRMRCPSTQ